MDEVSQTVFVVAIVMIPVTAVIVALRILDRFGRTQVPGWDDVMKYGLGTHHGDVSRQDYTIFLKFQMLTSINYSIAITSAKASFAVLYLRLFPVRSLLILNKVLITFLLFQAIEESFIVILKYRPIRRSWMPDLDGYCLDLHPLWYTTFAFNFSTDIILFVQPILMTWRLRMPLIKKFTIGVMLSLGFLVTGIAIIRLKYVITIDMDETFCSLIICSCIPSFRLVALRIPYLGTALGLSAGRDSVRYVTQHGGAIPLQRRDRKEYTRSKTSKFDRTNLFPSTTHTTATALGTIDDSNQNDHFLHRADSSGVIMIPWLCLLLDRTRRGARRSLADCWFSAE
ncbi:hypothetical protein F5B21DRAFT_514733 [Xylaria acuta]|nr:hypothetical protein F5B21DRAFT_514733 [Xylaria acuta]